jgi:hypothetical protein
LLIFASSVAHAQERIEISSFEKLLSFFKRLHYTPEAWETGIREVLRVYVMAVGDRWRVNNKNIEVINKKRIFFRALRPLALCANELTEIARAQLTL